LDIKELNAAHSIDHHPWEYVRFDVIYSLFKKYRNKKISHIFDIGCGDTFFMERFYDRFSVPNYHGIDTAFNDEFIHNHKIKLAKKKIELYKNLGDSKLAKTKADVVFLLDVIEHIEDDRKFLRDLHANPCITYDTQIYISVPAFKSLYVSRDKWLGHYRRYTLNQLGITLNECGYNVLIQQYFFTSLLFPRMLSVLKEKIIKPDYDKIIGIGGYKKKPIFEFIFVSVLKIDFLCSNFLNILGIKIPGLSCFVLCKKH
jgi:hypothetical protein